MGFGRRGLGAGRARKERPLARHEGGEQFHEHKGHFSCDAMDNPKQGGNNDYCSKMPDRAFFGEIFAR